MGTRSQAARLLRACEGRAVLAGPVGSHDLVPFQLRRELKRSSDPCQGHLQLPIRHGHRRGRVGVSSWITYTGSRTDATDRTAEVRRVVGSVRSSELVLIVQVAL